MIRLIVFGIESVLTDTKYIHHESLLDAIKYVTGLHRNEYEHLFRLDGSTTKENLKLLKVHANLSDLDLQLIDDKTQQNLIRHFFRGLRSSPNQQHMLDILAEKKYILAIASNSRKENVINILNILGITSVFNKILSSDDVVNSDPTPEMFQSIMNLYNVLPIETLILENSDIGKAVAKSSGAHLLAVSDINEVTLDNIENEIKRLDTILM